MKLYVIAAKSIFGMDTLARTLQLRLEDRDNGRIHNIEIPLPDRIMPMTEREVQQVISREIFRLEQAYKNQFSLLTSRFMETV